MSDRVIIEGRFEAKIDRMHKTQPTKEHVEGMWKVQFSVHPNDFPVVFATKSFGTRYMIAFAEIGDDEQPVQEPKQRSRTREAGILCNDAGFYGWLGKQGWPVTEADDAARAVRYECVVQSRRELDTDTEAAARWDALKDRFEQDTGRRAQRHG